MSCDCFWTIEYKQHWIHGHYDRDLKKEVIRIQCPHGSVYDAKSLHAAKYRITSFLRSRA